MHEAAGEPSNGAGASSGDRQSPGEWSGIRSEFDLSDEYVHLSALLISSHPRRLREAIENYRRKLDRNPVGYLVQHNQKLQAAARSAAARYVGGDADEVALTDSATMGLGLLYGGLRLQPGQEVLTTSNDYFATHEALRAASDRSGASVREIDLYEHGMPEAFAFHERIGSERIADRTHALARQLKEGLAGMPHVRLITPIDRRLSAGIVCFDVEGMRAHAVVRRLRDRRIIATVTPYATMHARLAPCILNTEQDIEMALEAVHGLA